MKLMMRLLTATSLIVASLVGTAEATSISFSGTSNSASIVYEGSVNYPNVSFTGDGTIISKDQGSLSGVLSVSYLAADLDYFINPSSGFRLTETITNNTGVAWTGYSLTLDPGVFFVAPPDAPNFVTVTAGSPYVVALNAAFGTYVLSAGNTRIDFTFANSLASGSSFSIHTPVWGLTPGQNGGFRITETAAVPEPASLALFGLGLIGVGAMARARRRQQ